MASRDTSAANGRSANQNETLTAQYFTESECLTTDSMSYNTPKTGKTGDVSKTQGKNKQVELDEGEEEDTSYTRIRRIIRERRVGDGRLSYCIFRVVQHAVGLS